MAESSRELILYRIEDGRSQIQMRAVEGTVWLTQAQIAELFDTGIPNVNKHIASILEDGELTEATIPFQGIVRQEGTRQVRREVLVYNLDMILRLATACTRRRCANSLGPSADSAPRTTRIRS